MALGVEGLRVGTYTDRGAGTGCTVVLPPPGTVGGVAVRGGAPGTREAAALGPSGTVAECHAVVLCGSSLFGLAAADGVVDWCERRGRGLALPAGCFPIVGAAVVMDRHRRGARCIDRGAGWAACDAARRDDPPMGRIGVGTGCLVGKEAGLEWASPGGQGWAVEECDGVRAGALLGVNALGSVLGPDGSMLAGCRAPDGIPRYPAGRAGPPAPFGNTVVGCVVTNARLGKPQACRLADLAHTGIARAVSPAHTSLDGDALFALATGVREARLDLVVELAARAVARAVRAGVAAAGRGEPEG